MRAYNRSKKVKFGVQVKGFISNSKSILNVVGKEAKRLGFKMDKYGFGLAYISKDLYVGDYGHLGFMDFQKGYVICKNIRDMRFIKSFNISKKKLILKTDSNGIVIYAFFMDNDSVILDLSDPGFVYMSNGQLYDLESEYWFRLEDSQRFLRIRNKDQKTFNYNYGYDPESVFMELNDNPYNI